MKRHPRSDLQLPLFWLCDFCGWPIIEGRGHLHCRVASRRWLRSDNYESWARQPARDPSVALSIEDVG
ncbi:MAG: hypothetical protein PGN27_04230 [Mycolicibacterium neoaurum]|uniref:hypothetical protein n=1 Tax=Mycolicibacterium neoaurum TaxID=1795 RepID=UPI002FFADBE7